MDERLAAAGLPPLPRTAWLEIDLDALTSNLALVRAAAGPGVAVRPVVKADAYGHGALPVARALVEAGVDGLCVATLDEALALRAGRIRAPVLVLYPIPPAWAPDAARRGIGISAGDPDLLAATLAALRPGRRQGSRRLRIELEVETGLGRGGFDPAAIVVAAAVHPRERRRRRQRPLDAPAGARGHRANGRPARQVRGRRRGSCAGPGSGCRPAMRVRASAS